MDIDIFVNIRAIIVLIQNVLPSRKNIGRYTSNNDRFQSHMRKWELDNGNINLDPKYLHIEHNKTVDNFSKGK